VVAVPVAMLGSPERRAVSRGARAPWAAGRWTSGEGPVPIVTLVTLGVHRVTKRHRLPF